MSDIQEVLETFADFYIHRGFTDWRKAVEDAREKGHGDVFDDQDIANLFCCVFNLQLTKVDLHKQNTGKSAEFITAADLIEKVFKYEELVALRDKIDSMLIVYSQHGKRAQTNNNNNTTTIVEDVD
jgi:hypothetical protein